MRSLIWKICGLRNSDNIKAVAELGPDMLGFIFYPDSPRYAFPELDPSQVKNLSGSIEKVGVFVNEENAKVGEVCEQYEFDTCQLHGDESPEQCERLKESGLGVIKAFSVDVNFDFSGLEEYEKYVDFFLFDTKGKMPGGNSFPFDWELLENYQFQTPFLLSGGISLENFEGIRDIHHPMLRGVDVNSRFEIVPGVKDVGKLKALKYLLEKMDSKNE